MHNCYSSISYLCLRLCRPYLSSVRQSLHLLFPCTQTSTVTSAMNCLVLITYYLGPESLTALATSVLAMDPSQAPVAGSSTPHHTSLLQRFLALLEEHTKHPMVSLALESGIDQPCNSWRRILDVPLQNMQHRLLG